MYVPTVRVGRGAQGALTSAPRPPPGAVLFGAQRPGRRGAPANPAHWHAGACARRRVRTQAWVRAWPRARPRALSTARSPAQAPAALVEELRKPVGAGARVRARARDRTRGWVRGGCAGGRLASQRGGLGLGGVRVLLVDRASAVPWGAALSQVTRRQSPARAQTMRARAPNARARPVDILPRGTTGTPAGCRGQGAGQPATPGSPWSRALLGLVASSA